MSTAAERCYSNAHENPRAPVRIQDVPRDVLKMYGIIMGSDDFTSTTMVASASVEAPRSDNDASDSDGDLVIDENPPSTADIVKSQMIVQVMPAPKPPHQFPLPPQKMYQFHAISFDSKQQKQKRDSKKTVACPVSARAKIDKDECDSDGGLVIDEGILSTPVEQQVKNLPRSPLVPPETGQPVVFPTKFDSQQKCTAKMEFSSGFCGMCGSHVTGSIAQHLAMHRCPQNGCLDVIQDEADRERHIKRHNHPTKPFQCTFCRKRYSFYKNSMKHMKYCRQKRGKR